VADGELGVSRQGPWDCPFCGRLSVSEPAAGPQAPQRHSILSVADQGRIVAVRCWYCGARGPLGDTPKDAIEKWQHSADAKGAAKW
jgi:transcription elongation factor Elf1